MEYNFDVKLKGNRNMFIDVHAHILDEIFENSEEVVKRANFAGVEKIIIASADCKESEEAVEFASKHDNIFCMIGVHPENCGDFEKIDNVFAKLAQNKKVVAIGEIGLDYHYPNTDKDKQKYAFRRQLEIAVKYNLPVIVHSRDAIMDTYNIISEYNVRGVIHCFSGSAEMAREFIKKGFLISIGGIVTFKNANNIIKVINDTSLSYILLETDSPYLTPEPYRKERNEPMYIPLIASKIASIKNVSLEEVRDRTTSNSCALFDFFRKK